MLVSIVARINSGTLDTSVLEQIALFLVQAYSVDPPTAALQFVREGFLANIQTLYNGFVSNKDPSFDLLPLWRAVSSDYATHQYQFIALHAFGEVAFVGLAETTPTIHACFRDIEKSIISVLLSIKPKNISVKQSLLNYLQDVILTILMASSR